MAAPVGAAVAAAIEAGLPPCSIDTLHRVQESVVFLVECDIERRARGGVDADKNQGDHMHGDEHGSHSSLRSRGSHCSRHLTPVVSAKYEVGEAEGSEEYGTIGLPTRVIGTVSANMHVHAN